MMVSNKIKTYDSHNKVSWTEPQVNRVAGLNAPAIDFKLLKNLP